MQGRNNLLLEKQLHHPENGAGELLYALVTPLRRTFSVIREVKTNLRQLLCRQLFIKEKELPWVEFDPTDTLH